MIFPVILNIAVCVPARDELANLATLLEEIDASLAHPLVGSATVIIFDDGSSDHTFARLRDVRFPQFELRVLRSMVHVGKSQGLRHALEEALALDIDAVITMDGDGQDDPAAIPALLEALVQGKDVINGRRVNREHPGLKRYSSRLFNAVVRSATGLPLLDINSGLKAYSRSAAITLLPYYYGELHRVVLVVAAWIGLEVGEVRVINRKRVNGKTKYGVSRGWRGIFDLLTIQFLRNYHSRPGHFFAGVGLLSMLSGLVALGVALLPGAQSLFQGSQSVLVVLGVGSVALGSILISFGFIAELLIFVSKAPPTSVVRSGESYRDSGFDSVARSNSTQ